MKRIARMACLAGLLLVVACREQPAPPPATAVVALAASALPATPADPAWQQAPLYLAKLIPQDLVEPRQLTTSTAEVQVRAIASASEVAFRLEWVDPSLDDRNDPARFCDACAVQLPAGLEAVVPAPQMGEPQRPVEITYWNAGWQARVDGRGDGIEALYPNASIDHYPFEAASLEKGSPAQQEMATRYAPAKAVGNGISGPRDVPVQDLIAQGPGTLAPAPPAGSNARGARNDTGWAVVITRRLPKGFAASAPTQVAFAVWQGAQQEVGARKMRTGWIPFSTQAKP